MLASLHALNRKLGEKLHGSNSDGIASRQVIRLLDQGQGRFSVQTIGSEALLAPHATITLINQRTHLATALTAGADGHLPKNAQVPGEPGDRFNVCGATGKHVFVLTASKGGRFYDDSYPTERSAEAALKSIVVTPRAGYQGFLGDCWALAGSLAVAAVRPEHIDQMLNAKNGLFGVQLYDYDRDADRFVPVTYLVDADIPWSAASTRAAPEGERNPHLWFVLLERAMAARRGSYDGLTAGSPAFAFEAMLGAKADGCSLIDTPYRELQQKVLEAKARRLPMVVSSSPRLVARLAQHHAYAVREVELDPRGRLLLHLENPWGRKHKTLDLKNAGRWASWLTIGRFPENEDR